MIGTMLALAAAVTAGPRDADTRAWWALSGQLSSDAMEGRDSGSPGHARAARLVAARLRAAGVRPLGEDGGYFQRVPMQEAAVTAAEVRAGTAPLRFLHDITVQAAPDLPATVEGAVAYRGYCAADALGDVRGRVVVCHGTHRAGLPDDAARVAAVRAGGAAALVTIADPGFAVEPPRWPFAYARAVWLAGGEAPSERMPRFTLNAEALGKLMPGQDAAALVAAGARGATLPSLDSTVRFQARFRTARRDYVSENVVGLLPGTDPARAGQAIVLSAHLDGYGRGEPVAGDGLYNGTLDDAAYVALLVRLAERRGGRGFARPVVLAAFTGEEKGLLGARWFVAHPTLPKKDIAADINLDQLRPIFPLELLTVHALDDTSLGADARAVAAGMGVAVQRDPEPERNLLRRADQWPFLQAGIPATAFVFGYRPGTESERIYRQWYRTGYHKPQDDIAQRIDWQAAADFNRFFYTLVERVADQSAAPNWVAGSRLHP